MAIQISIDGYDSFEQIGMGGMAVVYKARKTSIDKVVAIKILFPYLANDESFIERFQREAKSAAKLQHENVVNVIDFGESEGSYFIVMEYYEGMTLEDVLRRNRNVPLDIAVAALLEVCFGLEAAHSQDIVHRDIKPANIIYTFQGGIKIADFGLAKKSEAATMITQPGKVLGTPAYMSPEQAAGQRVGPQSDIFSLGVVAYELFCKRRPFEGKTYSEILEKIQTYDAPPITNVNPLIQPDFERIVEKMLEKNLSRRYQLISDLIIELERAMEKFDIRRDKRRLASYIRDPEAYERAFKEKMISRCLSQGSYFMQQGHSHLEEAILEFRKILFLDPGNERARRNLERILSQSRKGTKTVALASSPPPPSAKKERALSASGRSTGGPHEQSLGRQKRWWLGKVSITLLVSISILLVLATMRFRHGYPKGGWQRSAGGESPIILAPDGASVSEGDVLEFSLRTLHAEGDELFFFAADLPEGATISRSGRFRWKTDYDQAGSYLCRFFAANSKETTGAETRIEVIDKPSLKFEKIEPLRVRAGEKMQVLLKASSLSGNPASFALEGGPKGMRISGKSLVWRPRRDQAGTFSATVVSSDGYSREERNVVVTVSPKDAGKKGYRVQTGRLEWLLPKPGDIFVDGKIEVQGGKRLSVDLPPGEHAVRAELMGGLARFEKIVEVKAGKSLALETPRIPMGSLSVYFLGGIGEFRLDGKEFEKQPPFTSVPLPVGNYTAKCQMVKDSIEKEVKVAIREGMETIVEYEVGREPRVTFVDH